MEDTSLIKNRIRFMSALMALTITSVFSQAEPDNDLESWTTIGLRYELNKKWTFDLEEQLRLDNSSSEISEYFTELGTTYALTKHMEIGGGLRYIRENDNEGNVQGYENHLRFHLETTYSHKLNDFTLKYRLRYQNKNELGITPSDGDRARQHLRFKTSVKYNIKNWKFDPKFSAELFNRFEKGEEHYFNKYRLTLGTDYKLGSNSKIGLFYRVERELNVDLPETTSIIGVKYRYTFKSN